jgi:hypothetical protein
MYSNNVHVHETNSFVLVQKLYDVLQNYFTQDFYSVRSANRSSLIVIE